MKPHTITIKQLAAPAGDAISQWDIRVVETPAGSPLKASLDWDESIGAHHLCIWKRGYELPDSIVIIQPPIDGDKFNPDWTEVIGTLLEHESKS